jgi:hypothetical protein
MEEIRDKISNILSIQNIGLKSIDRGSVSIDGYFGSCSSMALRYLIFSLIGAHFVRHTDCLSVRCKILLHLEYSLPLLPPVPGDLTRLISTLLCQTPWPRDKLGGNRPSLSLKELLNIWWLYCTSANKEEPSYRI